MFCPKCGTQNPETGRFCRSCGADLGNVSAALSGDLPAKYKDAGTAHIHYEAKRRQDPNEVFGDSMKSIISGIGFLIISMVLFFTGVAGGHAWWWAMLFPAFGLFAKGIPDYLKYRKMEGQKTEIAAQMPQTLNQTPINNALPPTQTEYISPESRYKTGDLVPPSVVENTTRLLEIDKDGETETLPKK